MAQWAMVLVAYGDMVLKEGTYLKDFDNDVRAEYPSGAVNATDDTALAMRFNSPGDVFAAWNSQSKTCPLRPDGRPNKPLTAFTITPVEIT